MDHPHLQRRRGQHRRTPPPRRLARRRDARPTRCRVDSLISALTDTETRELGLADEPAAAQAAGLHFTSLPIPDLGVPADTAAFLTALDPLAKHVDAGEHVAVHCRAGIGRSGIIATLLLTHAGRNPAAVTHLSNLRGVAMPETDQQRTWLIATASARISRPGRPLGNVTEP